MERDTVMPNGVWPAMLMPFTANNTIDWKALDELIEWYIAAGVAGLFAVGQSGEMFALDDDERLAVARHVVERAAGRVPVVATGTFGGPVVEQARFVRRMADTGVAAVTVISGALAVADEDEDMLRERLTALIAATTGIPLALYECPLPYHRVMSPELVGWAAQSGRFHLLKETSRSVDAVRAKIDASAGTPLRVYNADTTALLDTLRAGGHGYCGIAANFYPDLLAWLCTHFEQYPARAEQLQAFFATVDPAIHQRYPLCAKHYRARAGSPLTLATRVMEATLTDYDRRVLDGIALQADEVRAIITG
jgi:4-hydroxy-tetrahydrodipicolinate synthase